MDSPSSSRRPTVEVAPSTRLLTLGVQGISILTLVIFLIVIWTQIDRFALPGKTGWLEALLVIATAMATLASLARTLPGPNVLLAAVIIGLIGSLAHGISAKTAYPFGPFVYQDAAGR